MEELEFVIQGRWEDIREPQHTNFLGAESKTPDLATLWREKNDAVTFYLGHSSHGKSEFQYRIL